MKRADVRELHYIAPIGNIASIRRVGIFSHNRAQAMSPISVANPEVQAIRAAKCVGVKPLHDFVNLYFHARNPMMYLRQASHPDLCVLQVSSDVLDLPGTVITDMNAASPFKPLPSPSGLADLDANLVFAEYWLHADPIEQIRRKAIRCAEVLVPDHVDIGHVVGAYVSNAGSQRALVAVGFQLPIILNPKMFFQA